MSKAATVCRSNFKVNFHIKHLKAQMFLKMKLSQPYDVIILFLVHVLDNEAAAGASHCDRMQRSTW